MRMCKDLPGDFQRDRDGMGLICELKYTSVHVCVIGGGSTYQAVADRSFKDVLCNGFAETLIVESNTAVERN